MNHDVYYTRFTRLDNGQVESWDLYVTLLDWHFNSGDNLHGMLDFNPTYERLFEPFEISPGVRPAARRVPLHALPEQPALDAPRSAGCRAASTSTWGNYWSGKAEQVTTALTYRLPPRFTCQPEHQPDVRAAAGRPLHRAHLHLERQLRRLAAAVVLEPGSVRQPVEEPRLAEPRPLDAAAGQRSVLRVQPGLESRKRGRSERPAVPAAGQQGVREVPVLVSLLIPPCRWDRFAGWSVNCADAGFTLDRQPS